ELLQYFQASLLSIYLIHFQQVYLFLLLPLQQVFLPSWLFQNWIRQVYNYSSVKVHKNNCKLGESNFGKAMMVGIPVAAAIGGIGTPAGSGYNYSSVKVHKLIHQI